MFWCATCVRVKSGVQASSALVSRSKLTFGGGASLAPIVHVVASEWED